MDRKITAAYFSPGGSTKEIAELFASSLDSDARYLDLIKSTPADTVNFGENDLLLIAMPVFAGRIPAVCRDMLCKLKSEGAYAAAIAVYGNRDFDDALLEICDILSENGFRIVGAAAFIARHSIFPSVAKDRPDAQDKAEILRFAEGCLENSTKSSLNLVIPGNRPYVNPSALPLRPNGKKSSCNGCNTCVHVCPVQAIDKDEPTKTDKTKCITCMACVYNCPTGSRGLHTPIYKIAGSLFAKKCATHLEPTIIL